MGGNSKEVVREFDRVLLLLLFVLLQDNKIPVWDFTIILN